MIEQDEVDTLEVHTVLVKLKVEQRRTRRLQLKDSSVTSEPQSIIYR